MNSMLLENVFKRLIQILISILLEEIVKKKYFKILDQSKSGLLLIRKL